MNDDIEDIELDDEEWNEFPEELKLSIKQSIDDLKNGRVIPHEEVMEKLKKWLKNKK